MATPRSKKKKNKNLIFTKVLRLKLTIVALGIVLFIGLNFIKEQINFNQAEAYRIGKTLKSLFTLEIFDPLTDPDQGQKNYEDVHSELTTLAPQHYVTIDEIYHSQETPSKDVARIHVRCHAELDGDIHGLLKAVLDNNKTRLAVDDYTVTISADAKKTNIANADIVFSLYSGD